MACSADLLSWRKLGEVRKCTHISAGKDTNKEWKTHPYWSVVKNRRISGRRVVWRQALSLGEFHDNQRSGWVRTIESMPGKEPQPRQLALFSDYLEALPIPDCGIVQVRLYKTCPRENGDRVAPSTEVRSKLAEYTKGTCLLSVDRSGERIPNFTKTSFVSIVSGTCETQ